MLGEIVMYEYEILVVLNLLVIIALYINAAVIGKALEMITEIHAIMDELISSALLVRAIGDGEFKLHDTEAGETDDVLFEDIKERMK
jgi:hypothetical protein